MLDAARSFIIQRGLAQITDRVRSVATHSTVTSNLPSATDLVNVRDFFQSDFGHPRGISRLDKLIVQLETQAQDRFKQNIRASFPVVHHPAQFLATTRNTTTSLMSRKRRRMTSSTRKRSKSDGAMALRKVRKLEQKREVKLFDSSAQITTIGTTGDIRSLALIAQGDLFNTRDGDHISPFRLKVNLQWLGVAAATGEVYRTIIFRDRRQVTSTVPAVLDVLVDGHPLSMIRASTRTRWKILLDQTFTRPSDTGSFQSFVTKADLRLTMVMGFQGAAATSINKNGLFMLNISNRGAQEPDVFFRSRLLYND